MEEYLFVVVRGYKEEGKEAEDLGLNYNDSIILDKSMLF